MNNKGFTLVELVVTILLLAILMSIGTYAIINTINSVKKKNIESLVTQIKSAAENYVTECTYSRESVVSMLKTASSANTFCARGENGTLSLGQLVEYGYLTGNAKFKDTKKMTLVNPNNSKDPEVDADTLSACKIKVKYDANGKFIVCGKSTAGRCKAIFPYTDDATC